MSGDIDEVSRLLGKLVTEAESNNRQLSALFTKFDSMQREYHEVLRIASEALRIANENKERQLQIEEALVKDIEENIKPTLEDYKRLKQRGIGIVTILSFIVALLAVAAKEAIKRWVN